MKNFWKAAALGLCIAGMAAGARAEKPAAKLDSLQRAALRAVARTRIFELSQKAAVRQGDPAVLDKEAQSVAARLSDAQLRALAAGGDVRATIAPSLNTAATAQALGESTSNLLFVPITPCRIIDTRKQLGKLQPGVVNSFQVVGTTEFGPQGGNIGGCGIPEGGVEPAAAAVAINFVAVNPNGSGNLRAWPYGQDVPLAAVINYDNLSASFAIANGIIIPVDGTNAVPADLSVRADFNATHLVADVTGYFTRFPTEQFASAQKSITEIADGGQVDLSSGACTQVNSCTITSSSAGQVIVRAWAQVQINHGTNVGGDRIAVGVKPTDPTNCTNNDQSINASDFEVPDSLPAAPQVDWMMSHKRIFAQSTGAHTYYINARMITGAGTGDLIANSRMICTFIPN